MDETFGIIDAEGRLRFEKSGYMQLTDLVGPEGPARVRLDPGWAMAGYVNDCGLLFPDDYPRNVVGSCVLNAMGARRQPYAGVVVIVGWNDQPYDVEVCGLSEGQEDLVKDAHRCVLLALAGKPVGAFSLTSLDEPWAAHVRDFAEYVRTAETPKATLVNDPVQVEAMLRGEWHG